MESSCDDEFSAYGIKKKTSAHARFFVRFITKERSTHTFSLDLNFSRTEALLLIKCLLWCVLYRTPAISGSVAILKSFFCWAHTPPPPRSCLLLSTTFCFPFIPALPVQNASLTTMWKTNKGNRMFCQDFC